MRRLASALAVLLLLLGHASAGLAARAPARPCCCKAGEPTHPRVARGRCCGHAERGRAPTPAVVRVPDSRGQPSPLILPARPSGPGAPAPSIDDPRGAARPPDHGIGRALPYRLRI